jgi:hypothetical protein
MSEAAKKHGRILPVGSVTRFNRNAEVFRRIVADRSSARFRKSSPRPAR